MRWPANLGLRAITMNWSDGVAGAVTVLRDPDRH
jgi:hypothetical protein